MLDQISNNIYEIGAIDSNHTYNITFGTIVGIDKESMKSISLYYQTGILYVNGIDENATIAIYDLTGKLVKVTEEAPINIANLTKGCYIVFIPKTKRHIPLPISPISTSNIKSRNKVFCRFMKIL